MALTPTSPRSPATKRHAMILPQLVLSPALALPSIGEDHVVSYERRGSETLAFWTPTEVSSSTEDYFGIMQQARPAGPSPVLNSVRYSQRSQRKSARTEVPWL